VKPYELHPSARFDLDAAAAYYEQKSFELAGRFVVEIDQLIAEIRAAPQVPRFFRGEARRHFRRTFPYAVIYVDEPDLILVLAVSHFKRRPGYWIDRLLRD
jgi:toxin ParE1/3/4